MHIPTVRRPTVRHVQKRIQCGDNAFSIALTDAYLIILIVKHHHHFLQFVWQNMLFQW